MTPEQIRARVERLTEALVCRGAVAWLDGDSDRGWLRVMTDEDTIDCGVREEFDGTALYVIQRRGMVQPQPLARAEADIDYVATALLGWLGRPPPYADELDDA